MSLNITIGYDDHTSTYIVDDEHIPQMSQIDNTDELNDFIISNGTFIGNDDSLFLDLYGSVDDFRQQLIEHTEDQ